MVRKALIIIVVCAIGCGLYAWHVASPARAAGDTSSGQLSAAVLDEIRGLRGDIAALRSEIAQLRAELRGGKPHGGNVSSTRPTGTILAPTAGETVSATIDVSGKISGIPSDNHVWLAIARGNLLWPKEPEITPREADWRIQAFEGGAPGKLSLLLLMVGPEGHKRIEEWFEQGSRTGNYPGLPGIPGSVQLDTVRDLSLR